MSIFETASRKPLRFKTNQRANLTVEDLWRLPLTKLQEAGQDIFQRLAKAEAGNFLDSRKVPNLTDTLMLDVVKHIIKVRQDENVTKAEAKVIATRNDMIDRLVEDKEGEEMKKLSVEELLKLKVD